VTQPLETTAETPAASAARLLVDHWLWLGVAVTCGAVAGFLGHQLLAWPPHEDETLALFVGRDSLPGVVEHVTRERGGAPLHFLFAWVVAHAGLGLEGLRAVSAAFAVASLPLVALLGVRLADRRAALIATVLAGGSWMLLFHGVYGRMYSLFLFTSLLAWLGLLHALDRRGAGPWALWVGAMLACVATHPYGALVLVSQGVFVALAHRHRLPGAAVAFVVLLVAGIPFWLTDLVLAGRFDVGVGGGGEKLGGPAAVARYLWRSAGDLSAGWWPVLLVMLGLAVVGLCTARRETRVLAAAIVGVPALAFFAARFGSSTSPESRHLIFALPVFAVLVAVGILRVSRRATLLAPLLVAVLLVAEVAWAWDRTPPLFEWEPDARQAARSAAGAYLAASNRPGDILFGYEPLWLDGWARQPDFSRTVLPRADATLALRQLRRQSRPLGHGVWVIDGSDTGNAEHTLAIDRRTPTPADAFEVRAFGPFLVIRSREPTRTPERYLYLAARVQLLGRSLGVGDADINMRTVERAERARRGYASSERSLSSSSR
jgi:hypothetical protein